MAEPHWTGYMGMFLGAIGTVIAGISLYRSFTVKALDLRIELRKAFNELEFLERGLETYLNLVHKSHLAVFSADVPPVLVAV